MASSINLRALGLNFAPNALELPPGSLTEANNINIKRNDVIESRRGFKLWGEVIPNEETAKQLAIYRQRILRFYGSKLAFQNGVNISGEARFTELSGEFAPVDPNLRQKYIEAKNGNFYFTSDSGIQKISAKDGDQLNSAIITPAGGIKALDLTASVKYTLGDSSSFLPENSIAAYKLVWGKYDNNNVELLGAPSERAIVYNPLKTLLRMDLNRLLQILFTIKFNSTVPVNLLSQSDVDELSATKDTNADDLRTKLIRLAEKIDTNHTLNDISDPSYTTTTVEGSTVTIESTDSDKISVGQKIKLSNFKSNGIEIKSLNTEQIVTSTEAELVDSSIKFVPSSFTLSNSAGISGEVSEYTAAANSVITTLIDHGLETNQKIDITLGATKYFGRTVTKISEKKFSIDQNPGAAGTSGSWYILVDDGGEIYNNKYRSIQQPVEIVPENSSFIPDLRGTGEQLFSLQNYLSTIASNLINENTNIFTVPYKLLSGLSNFTITKTASVELEFTVPYNIDGSYFYQLYRTPYTQYDERYSTPLEDASPQIDYFLIDQKYINLDDISDDYVLKITDNISDAFLKTPLYTNPSQALGAQPNSYPPLSHDINRFKGYTFYSNTKIKQIRDLELLGVVKLKDEIESGKTPNIIFSDGTNYNNCKINFARGVKRVVSINVGTGLSGLSTSETYIDINSANNINKYRFWFKVGAVVEPTIEDRQLIQVYVDSYTIDDAGNALANSINFFIDDFNAVYDSGVITISYQTDGVADDIILADDLLPFSWDVPAATEEGVSESVSTATAVIPSDDLLTPAVSTYLTTKSLIRVLNRNTSKQENFDTYAYYSSSSTSTTPGLFLLEGTFFTDLKYYLSSNSKEIGQSFYPDISPVKENGTTIDGSDGSSEVLLTITGHNLQNGDSIIISNSNSTPNIDGVYFIQYIDENTIKINLNTTPISFIDGDIFYYSKVEDTESSDNYTKKNRIYWSKYEQPEAVDSSLTGNFLPVGSEDKEILRIVPLKDSLFIFKEDGLFRLSAEYEPFIVSLFDSSCILLAPDSIGINKNMIFCWTTQGIAVVSESGVSIISTPIDTEIFKLQSNNYTNFKSATFGVGYESDNSYIVWTVSKQSDTQATQAFRFCTVTNTWTKYTKSNTCGILNPVDDTLYLGAADSSYIEQERKTFSREDYCDYEYNQVLTNNSYFDIVLKLSTVSYISSGDVITQVQPFSIYDFNSLLKKLDLDPGLDNNYSESLSLIAGDSIRDGLVSLAGKLDIDTSNGYTNLIESKSGSFDKTNVSLGEQIIINSPGHGLTAGRIINISKSGTISGIEEGNYTVISVDEDNFSIDVELKVPLVQDVGAVYNWISQVNNFQDIRTCYINIVNKLNIDLNVTFSNYLIAPEALLETVIVEVDKLYKKITVKEKLDFTQGPITIYKAINSTVTYAPNTFGDVSSLKQVREATLLFANKAFTIAEIGFSTDLMPAFSNIEFQGDGAGLFGNSPFGEGFFGGGSNSAPFRTMVPLHHQRCRFINVKFTHRTAREQYELYGITLTGKAAGTRAYR